MPFIKFTETVSTAEGIKEKLVFINVDHIAKATYEEDRKHLQIHVAGTNDDPKRRGQPSVYSLDGDDAVRAAEVLCTI